MLKVGDFARLTRVSIQMLRYYDEPGMLKPAHTDATTRVRAFGSQLPGFTVALDPYGIWPPICPLMRYNDSIPSQAMATANPLPNCAG